jgi:radical SAM superfamily enzyme YgiQ (UPF0313 family)
MKVILINPNIVSQIIDVSGTGIPYMPIALAYVASFLKEQQHDITLIDAFGEAPTRVNRIGDKLFQGLDALESVKRIPQNADIIFVFGHLSVTFLAQKLLVQEIKRRFPVTPVGILENINNVNAYALRAVKKAYYQWGLDYLILGCLEHRTHRLITALKDHQGSRDAFTAVPGLFFRGENDFIENSGLDEDCALDLDALPFPAWNLLPLQNYWSIKYAHAPFTTDKYLPLLSSRGCPFKCRFCVSSGMEANRRWNPRTPKNLVDEIAFFNGQLGVSEFHFEDLNPGVDRKRLAAFCDELIARGLHVQWKFAQGTKLEALDEPLIQKMAAAGCTYVSISPESGSQRLLKLVNKPVDNEHALRVVAWLKKYGIKSQGCFVIGLPEETDDDREQSLRLLLALARAGLDDPAFFIITLMPGSELGSLLNDALPSPDACTFTPVWRPDYKKLSRFRKKVYIYYLWIKLLYHPGAFIRYFTNFITRRFETKVEMTLYRKAYVFVAFVKKLYRHR